MKTYEVQDNKYTPVNIKDVKTGDTVVLVAYGKISTGNYTLGKANPLVGTSYECAGVVISASSTSVKVGWDNGKTNYYVNGDLAFAGYKVSIW